MITHCNGQRNYASPKFLLLNAQRNPGKAVLNAYYAGHDESSHSQNAYKTAEYLALRQAVYSLRWRFSESEKYTKCRYEPMTEKHVCDKRSNAS